jgi:peptidoglycan/LPS O-acetylase OafA/YrhL
VTSTGDWRLGHRPALDGVRGIAVALVVLGHAGVPLLVNAGAVGVDTFFTLSGFLITSLLLEERSTHGSVRFGAFYRRRALRLLPALVALVAGVWVIRVALGLGSNFVSVPGTAAALLYYTNLWIFHGSSGVLSHTWSLSLEEQFYLTWPLLLVVLYRWGRHRAVLWGALVLGSASVASFYLSTGDLRSFAPDTRSFHLLFGCALAAALTGAARMPVPSRLLAVPAALLLLLASLANGGVAAEVAPVAIVGGGVVLIWVAGTRDLPALEGRALTWLGRRSYAIYLWHFPAIGAALRVGGGWPVHLVVIGGFGVTMAVLSWRFIERPFLNMKQTPQNRAVPQAITPRASV